MLDPLTQLAIIITLGIAAQVVGAKLKWPSVLLLLVFGCAAGAGAQWMSGERLIDPAAMFGDLLQPAVALAVALILFEGGLSLKLAEMREVGGVVRNLLSIGVLVTWALSAAAAHYILGFDLGLALLVGAMLVVTGPTVIGPILRQVRPAKPVGPILKWEGIVIDPIGAVLAVLVFEVITAGPHSPSVMIGRTLGVGIGGGAIAAWLLIVALRRYWVPDSLHNPVTLALVAIAFTASNHYQHESGLLTVTVMGLIMANQKRVSIRHIVEFKENLRTLLISVLFIVLAARIDLEQVKQIGLRDALFVIVLITVIRPAGVWLCTIGSSLSKQQRIYLSLIAPRGIVAAAVATVFGFEMNNEQIVPAVFLVIIATVAFGGLIAALAAKALGLVSANPQGFIFVGAHEWARTIAEALKEQNIAVTLVDTNLAAVRAARMAGLTAVHGSVLDDEVIDRIDLSPMRRMLALTPNDEANALAVVHNVELFGRAEMYQLVPMQELRGETLGGLRGRYLFAEKVTWWHLRERFAAGAVIKTTNLTDQYGLDEFRAQYGDAALPLFVITDDGSVRVFTVENPPTPKTGDAIVFLLDHDANEQLSRSKLQR